MVRQLRLSVAPLNIGEDRHQEDDEQHWFGNFLIRNREGARTDGAADEVI
jgi:hypothetical protein